MKIKKNTFSTLVLELFFPSTANCRKLKIQKKSKNRLPLVYSTKLDAVGKLENEQRWNSSSKCTLESVHYICKCLCQNIHIEGERGDFRW
jgi:hypothetical protein